MSLTRIAGDPGAIASYARQMDDYSDELMDAALALRKVANTETSISEAVDAFRGDALQAAEDTGKVVTRYVGAAAALAAWAQRLEPIQREGNAAADAWDAAHHDIAEWTRRRDDRAAEYALAPDGTPEQDDARKRALLAQGQLDDAGERLRHAKARYDQAIADYNAAAKETASAIDAAQEMSQLNDGFWDEMAGLRANVTNWVYEHAELLENIKKWVDAIANVLSWIALGLTVIGFPEVGVIFGALSLALAVLSYQITFVLFLSGVGTSGDLIKSGISMVVSAVSLGTAPASATGEGVKMIVDEWINVAETANTADGFREGDGVSPGDVIDLIPGTDFSVGPPLGSLDGPMWTRPPDMEIPSFNPADYAPQDLPQVVCESAQVSFDLGELKVQAFVEVCR